MLIVRNPTCEIVLYASSRLIRNCASPTTVPIINDSNDETSK